MTKWSGPTSSSLSSLTTSATILVGATAAKSRIITLGSTHFVFSDFPDKFIMQVQEHCANTERGWKHMAGHLSED